MKRERPLDRKPLSRKAREAQAYWFYWYKESWLSSWGPCSDLTEEQRWEFYEYDSRGGPYPAKNPILWGKKAHGHIQEVLWTSYFDPMGWVGGLFLVEDYLMTYPYGWRPLYEWFFEDMVDDWISALLDQFHYPPTRGEFGVNL